MKKGHLILLSLPFQFTIHGYSQPNNRIKPRQQKSRRSFLAVPIAIPLPFIKAREADALQPKNDLLCGTGFFEHIYEYKCTVIGDIQDEGIAKDMSSKEVDMTDNLIWKLGLSSYEGGENNVSRDDKAAKTKLLQGSDSKNEVMKNSEKYNEK